MTAILSVMLSTMLLFTFEGHETATRKDLVIAWSPVLFLGFSIGESLLGLKFWYSGKNKGWIATMVGGQLAICHSTLYGCRLLHEHCMFEGILN